MESGGDRTAEVLLGVLSGEAVLAGRAVAVGGDEFPKARNRPLTLPLPIINSTPVWSVGARGSPGPQPSPAGGEGEDFSLGGRSTPSSTRPPRGLEPCPGPAGRPRRPPPTSPLPAPRRPPARAAPSRRLRRARGARAPAPRDVGAAAGGAAGGLRPPY